MGANESNLAETPKQEEAKPIPTVFRWFFGGRRVFVTGSFNDWKERIPLTKSDDDFMCVVELPPGKHDFKFVVDDEWRIDPTMPTVPDGQGNVNNEIEVKEPLQKLTDPVSFETLEKAKAESEGYSQIPQAFEENRKYPPPLPSHLCFSYLNPLTPAQPTSVGSQPAPSVVPSTVRRPIANFSTTSTTTSSISPRPGPLMENSGEAKDHRQRPISYNYMRTQPNSFHLYAGTPPPPSRPGTFPIAPVAPHSPVPHVKPSVDAVGMPVPAQVTLNHVYFANDRPDGVVVMSAGQRYHHKYTTVIFFKPTKSAEDKPLSSSLGSTMEP